jgi:hypothetical protein
VADEVLSSSSVIGDVRDLNLAALQRTSLGHATSDRARKLVLVLLDGEVGKGDLVGVTGDDCRQTKVLGLDLVVSKVQFEISAVVDLAPLQLWVVGCEPVRSVVCVLECDVLAVGRRGRDGRSCELDTQTTGAGRRGVVAVVEPDKVGNPVGVAVSGNDDVVANVVVGQVLQRAVAVRLVSVPCIVVERVDVAVLNMC